MDMILINRIVYALDSSAEIYEDETQRLAEEVIDFHSEITYDPSGGPMHRFLALRIAQSAVFTSAAWKNRQPEEEGPGSNLGSSVVDVDAFDEFDDLICGRRSPYNGTRLP
jgi:hypothetical protein